jgi:hypothetical protein
MMINRSETSAARRLFQCEGMGVYENDISPKFFDSDSAVDLTQEEFDWRRNVIKQVEDWCEGMENKPGPIYQNEWTPILYKYEVRWLGLTKLGFAHESQRPL